MIAEKPSFESKSSFSKQPPEAPFLYSKRPVATQRKIDHPRRRTSGYAHNGVRNSYSYYIGSQNVTTDQAVARARAEHGGPVSILDIGCGAGGLVLKHLNAGHWADGLTLHDYRDGSLGTAVPPELPDEHYIVGNVENLHSVGGLRDEYDVIVSSFTFMHLYEPLGTLEQVVDKLAPGGGYLLIDGLYSPGNHSRMEYVHTDEHVIHGAFEAADIHAVKNDPETELMRHDLYYQRGHTTLPFRIPIEFRNR